MATVSKTIKKVSGWLGQRSEPDKSASEAAKKEFQAKLKAAQQPQSAAYIAHQAALAKATAAQKGTPGWTAAGIAPKAAASSPEQVGTMLKDPALASRGRYSNIKAVAPPEIQKQIADTEAATGKPVTLAGSSSIGWLNEISKNPVTADQLIPNTGGTKDKTLASRTSLLNPLTGVRDTAAQVSTFKSDNAPQAIREEITSLNQNQAVRRAAQAEYIDALMKRSAAGDVYAAEALRAASIQPGSSAGFGERIWSGDEMAGNAAAGQGVGAAGQGAGALQQEQAKQIRAQNADVAKLKELQARKALIGPHKGFYEGSEQQSIDKQIMAMGDVNSPNSAANQRSIAAAGVNPSSSGWVGWKPGTTSIY
jgi:hypothetical protein